MNKFFTFSIIATLIAALIIPSHSLFSVNSSHDAYAASNDIYAIGGVNSGGTLASVETYNPGTNTWTTVAPMPTPRGALAAAVDLSGNIYAIGGIGSAGVVLNTVEKYNPGTNTWTTVAPMPTGRSDIVAAVDSSGNIYSMGGTPADFALAISTVEKYNPGTNTWTTVAPMSIPRAFLASVSSNPPTISAVLDTTAPVVTVPSPITQEATSSAGATVTFTVTATDPDDAASLPTCNHASGSTFPLGTTSVTCSSTDTHGNTGSASFTIAVQDTTPPVLILPSPITVQATSTSGATVTYTATATDLVDGSVIPICTPPSGSTFAIGATTTVTCSATDSHGNTATGSFTVTVETPAQAIGQLINLKESMHLDKGITTSLDAKLNAALSSLNSGNNNAAKNQLSAFIHEVNAQTGKKITITQQSLLVDTASAIQLTIN